MRIRRNWVSGELNKCWQLESIRSLWENQVIFLCLEAVWKIMKNNQSNRTRQFAHPLAWVQTRTNILFSLETNIRAYRNNLTKLYRIVTNWAKSPFDLFYLFTLNSYQRWHSVHPQDYRLLTRNIYNPNAIDSLVILFALWILCIYVQILRQHYCLKDPCFDTSCSSYRLFSSCISNEKWETMLSIDGSHTVRGGESYVS